MDGQNGMAAASMPQIAPLAKYKLVFLGDQVSHRISLTWTFLKLVLVYRERSNFRLTFLYLLISSECRENVDYYSIYV